jgi:two-component system response regulator HydG
MAYSWPGNVRELKNNVESMVVMDVDGILDLDDLTEEVQSAAIGHAEPHAGKDGLVGKPLDDVEKYYIAETLKLTQGNREEAARMLGIGERTLYRKIKDYGLN